LKGAALSGQYRSKWGSIPAWESRDRNTGFPAYGKKNPREKKPVEITRGEKSIVSSGSMARSSSTAEVPDSARSRALPGGQFRQEKVKRETVSGIIRLFRSHEEGGSTFLVSSSRLESTYARAFLRSSERKTPLERREIRKMEGRGIRKRLQSPKMEVEKQERRKETLDS